MTVITARWGLLLALLLYVNSACLHAREYSDRLSPVALPALDKPVGLRSPTLAFGLGGIYDWSGVLPFIDVMKSARPWTGWRRRQSRTIKFDELGVSGCFDKEGWPTCLPFGVDGLRLMFSWPRRDGVVGADYRAGRYHLFYQGSGELKVENVDMVSERPGHMVFDVSDFPGNWWIDVLASEPGESGEEYLRDMHLIREQHLTLWQAGERFAPDWLHLIDDARQVRFMDWARVNERAVVKSENMPKESYYSWVDGVPLSVQVELANRIGADPWFALPYAVTDEQVREMSAYVRDHLDPRLVAFVEYGNEAWNTAFKGTRHLQDLGRRELGTDELGAYYRLRAAQVMRLWSSQYNEQQQHRYRRVLGGQVVNIWLSKKLIAGETVRKQRPDVWRPANEDFDVLAVAAYFGSKAPRDDYFVSALGSEQSDFSALTRYFRDADNDGSLPFLIERLRGQKEVANAAGLGLVLYEGGQHIHYSHRALNSPSLQKRLQAFIRSDEMAELYAELWQAWRGMGSAPFMHFVEAGPSNKYGSWGLRLHPGDNPPRALKLDELNAITPAWWPSSRDDGYQQGIRVTGSDAGDELVGSVEEDVLLGGSGNDRFYPGPASDSIHGGEGLDTVLLNGRCRSYQVSAGAQTGQWLVDGQDGHDTLFAVERLLFADGMQRELPEGSALLTECEEARPNG